MRGQIAYRNMVPAATLTLSQGVAIDGFPLDNVKERALEVAFRCTVPGGSPWITLDLAVEDRTTVPKVLGLLNVSGGRPNSGFFSLWRSTSSSTGPWTNVANYLTVEGSRVATPNHLIMPLPSLAAARWWQIRTTLLPTGVTPNWYYQTGALWLSGSVDFNFGKDIGKGTGVAAGWKQGFVDTGQLDMSAGKQAHETPGRKLRTLSCSVKEMPPEVAYGLTEAGVIVNIGNVQDLVLEHGKTGPVIAIPREHGLWPRRTAIYGHLRKEPSIDHGTGKYYKVDMEFEEEG